MEHYAARQGFYFCHGDVIAEQTLKRGTFNDAQEVCNQILTPETRLNSILVWNFLFLKTKLVNWKQICTSNILNDFFINHPEVIQNYPIITQMWTGAKRHNETHFKDSFRFYSIEDLGLV